MKKINTIMLALMSILMLGWTSCTDSVDYMAAGPVEGQGVYFPTSVKTSYTLDGTSGEITLSVMRTDTINATDAAVTATITEGGENLFTVPSTVSFAEGESTSSMTIAYDNIVRGTTYQITLTFAEGTPYSNSSITLTVLYPEEIVYEWEVISEDAIFTENIFSMYGGTNIAITKLTVEKAKGYNLYRFKSPYDNNYMAENWGLQNFFPENFEYPYIVLDGETYSELKKWYIAPTNLGFKMTDGKGPSVDQTWNTFGSIAGNLQTSAGPIPPESTDYPLGTYDEKKQLFDLGATYHNLDGYGFFILNAGSFTLALNPALLAPDYDRDYTWKDVPEATGFFTTQIEEFGENNYWNQLIQQAEEDPTFYRMPNLYSAEEKAHLYFHVDMEKGTVDIPRGQNSGLVTFGGNTIYIQPIPNKSSYNTQTGKLILAIEFYLADESGKLTTSLAQVYETFLWGQSEIDQLQTKLPIDKYVGNWVATLDDGEGNGGETLVNITKKDATTLVVKGLSGGVIEGYDDSFLLNYDAETGYLGFQSQYTGVIQGMQGIIGVCNSRMPGSFGLENLIGGLDKEGNFLFINDPSNQGRYDGMIYVVDDGQGQYMFLSGYWNNLSWPAYVPETESFATPLAKARMSGSFQSIEKGFEPRRVYIHRLNAQPQSSELNKQRRNSSVKLAPSIEQPVAFKLNTK